MTSYAVPRDGEMKMWFVSSAALFRGQHCPMAIAPGSPGEPALAEPHPVSDEGAMNG